MLALVDLAIAGRGLIDDARYASVAIKLNPPSSFDNRVPESVRREISNTLAGNLTAGARIRRAELNTSKGTSYDYLVYRYPQRVIGENSIPNIEIDFHVVGQRDDTENCQCVNSSSPGCYRIVPFITFPDLPLVELNSDEDPRESQRRVNNLLHDLSEPTTFSSVNFAMGNTNYVDRLEDYVAAVGISYELLLSLDTCEGLPDMQRRFRTEIDRLPDVFERHLQIEEFMQVYLRYLLVRTMVWQVSGELSGSSCDSGGVINFSDVFDAHDDLEQTIDDVQGDFDVFHPRNNVSRANAYYLQYMSEYEGETFTNLGLEYNSPENERSRLTVRQRVDGETNDLLCLARFYVDQARPFAPNRGYSTDGFGEQDPLLLYPVHVAIVNIYTELLWYRLYTDTFCGIQNVDLLLTGSLPSEMNELLGESYDVILEFEDVAGVDQTALDFRARVQRSNDISACFRQYNIVYEDDVLQCEHIFEE